MINHHLRYMPVNPPSQFKFPHLASDPPEPEETECTDEYVEGSCECCDHFEQCKQVWKGDEE